LPQISFDEIANEQDVLVDCFVDIQISKYEMEECLNNQGFKLPGCFKLYSSVDGVEENVRMKDFPGLFRDYAKLKLKHITADILELEKFELIFKYFVCFNSTSSSLPNHFSSCEYFHLISKLDRLHSENNEKISGWIVFFKSRNMIKVPNDYPFTSWSVQNKIKFLEYYKTFLILNNQ
jgi:hypothetical protein